MHQSQIPSDGATRGGRGGGGRESKRGNKKYGWHSDHLAALMLQMLPSLN